MNSLGKKFLQYGLACLISAGLVAGFGAYTSATQGQIDDITASYKLTDFDYMTVSPSDEQIAEFKTWEEVDKVFPAYNFKIKIKGNSVREMPVLFSNDMTNYDISLFNDKTLLEGQYDETGMMLDENAANLLKVDVNDEVKFSLANVSYTLKVAGIYRNSTYPNLDKGLGLAKISEEMLSHYDHHITYDMAFIKSKDANKLQAKLDSYIPLGLLIPEQQYIDDFKAHNLIPPATTEEQWTEQIRNAYQIYKEEFLAKNYDGYAQDKTEFLSVINERSETLAERNNIVMWVSSILIAVIYMGALIFIGFSSLRDDEIYAEKGHPMYKMMLTKLGISISSVILVALSGLAATMISNSVNNVIAGTLFVLMFTLPLILPLLATITINSLITCSIYKDRRPKKERKAKHTKQETIINNTTAPINNVNMYKPNFSLDDAEPKVIKKQISDEEAAKLVKEHSVSEEWTCPKCGHIHNKFDFCRECGHQLEKVKAKTNDGRKCIAVKIPRMDGTYHLVLFKIKDEEDE